MGTMTMEDNSKILSGRHLMPTDISQQLGPEMEEGGFEDVGKSLQIREPVGRVNQGEVTDLKKKNEKLLKENSLFKEEYRVLMNTIKNLQSEVSRSKQSKSARSQPQNSLGIKAIESQKLKRQNEFLVKENQRLKNMNETMKNFSQEDFSKILEMNTYYKMLNGELEGYIHELKDVLSKINCKIKKLRNRCT